MQGAGFMPLSRCRTRRPVSGSCRFFRNAAASVPYTFRVSATARLCTRMSGSRRPVHLLGRHPIPIKARAYSGSPVAGLAIDVRHHPPGWLIRAGAVYDDGLEAHGDFREGDGEFSASTPATTWTGYTPWKSPPDNHHRGGHCVCGRPVTEPQPGRRVRPPHADGPSHPTATGIRWRSVNADGTVNEDDLYLLAQYSVRPPRPRDTGAMRRQLDGIVDVLDHARVARKSDTGAPPGLPARKTSRRVHMSLDPRAARSIPFES